MNTSGAAF